MARIRPRQGGFRDDPFASLVYALEDFDSTRQTATKDAEDKGARLDAFSIDDKGIHVTVFKRAKSYVLYKFSQTRHWYDVRVSASATPD